MFISALKHLSNLPTSQHCYHQLWPSHLLSSSEYWNKLLTGPPFIHPDPSPIQPPPCIQSDLFVKTKSDTLLSRSAAFRMRHNPTQWSTRPAWSSLPFLTSLILYQELFRPIPCWSSFNSSNASYSLLPEDPLSGNSSINLHLTPALLTLQSQLKQDFLKEAFSGFICDLFFKPAHSVRSFNHSLSFNKE